MGEAWRSLGGYGVGIVPIFIVPGPAITTDSPPWRDRAADNSLWPHHHRAA